MLLTATFVLVWACMLTVHALVPPVQKLSDQSALVGRLFWFFRVLWAATLFGAAAVYSASVAVHFEGLITHGVNESLWADALAADVWPIVGEVALFAGWYALASCAWDLWRSKPKARRRVYRRLEGMVDRLLPSPYPQNPLASWLGNLTRSVTTGPMPWIAAYAAPMFCIGIWNWLMPGGNPVFRLF